MTKNDVLRFLIARLSLMQDTVFEVDYGRIEELCFLINAAMNDFGKIPRPGVNKPAADT